MSHLAGALLVATPRLVDPNFSDSVVLVCAHDAEGALGLILNRPTSEPAAQHLPAWAKAICNPPVVFVGGPVQPDMAVAVARARGEERPDRFNEIRDGLGLLDLASPADEVTPLISSLRVFSGYAGWGPGQLEEETESHDWFVVEGAHDEALTPEPLGMWRRVLRRHGGRAAVYAYYPPDPGLN